MVTKQIFTEALDEIKKNTNKNTSSNKISDAYIVLICKYLQDSDDYDINTFYVLLDIFDKYKNSKNEDLYKIFQTLCIKYFIYGVNNTLNIDILNKIYLYIDIDSFEEQLCEIYSGEYLSILEFFVKSYNFDNINQDIKNDIINKANIFGIFIYDKTKQKIISESLERFVPEYCGGYEDFNELLIHIRLDVNYWSDDNGDDCDD